MRRILGWTVWGLLAAASLVAGARDARAAELSAEERKWLRQCVEALRGPSDRVVAGGEDGIVRLGADALPAIVPLLSILDAEDDSDWAGLGRALAGVGAGASADALESARSKWPQKAKARIAQLVEDLRGGNLAPRKPPAAPALAGGRPAADDPTVEARVRELLDRYVGRNHMSTSDPEVEAIVRMGRAAIPALLRYIVERAGAYGMGVSAAAHALSEVVTEADVPEVAKALAAGGFSAASCLKKFRTAEARDALLDVVLRGFMDHAVLEGLEPHGSDPAVGRALSAWLETQGARMDWDVGAVARFCAEQRIDAALPALRPLLRLDGPGWSPVAIAAASLGEKDAIPLLIRWFREPGADADDYLRHEAGKALNRIVGEAMFVGSYTGAGRSVGNWGEAARAFQAWWDANGDRLVFDAPTHRWRLK